MKLFRKIQITAASALVGLSLYGCNQPVETSTPAATETPVTTSTNSPSSVVTNSAPALTNDAPATTTNSSLLPESTMPVSTNELPTAAPLPVTQ
jgi:hypothetical protein